MQKTIMYRTADGKTFESREEAKAHEVEMATLDALQATIEPIIRVNQQVRDGAMRLISLMLGDPHTFIAILRKHATAKSRNEPSVQMRMAV